MSDPTQQQREAEAEAKAKARESGASAPTPGERSGGEAPGRDREAAGRGSAGASAPTPGERSGGEAPGRDRAAPPPAEGETTYEDAEAPAASAAATVATEASEADIAEELAAAEQRAGEYLALAQRAQADFENFRKRMARENAQASARGVSRLAKELLPALDHFDLALRSVQADEETRKGFTLVRDELVNALGKVGIEPFSPEGEAFDPAEHEAMAQHPVEGAASGTVVEVYQQGYRIDGAVLRPARVIVAA